jgi:hypothetical protein
MAESDDTNQTARDAMDDSRRHERPRCGARNRRGQPCGRFPVPGRRRCRFHGGHAKRGADSPNFVHGRRSRLPDLLTTLEQYGRDANLRAIHIGLGTLSRGIEEAAALAATLPNAAERRRAERRVAALLVDQTKVLNGEAARHRMLGQTLTPNQISGFLRAMAQAVRDVTERLDGQTLHREHFMALLRARWKEVAQQFRAVHLTVDPTRGATDEGDHVH